MLVRTRKRPFLRCIIFCHFRYTHLLLPIVQIKWAVEKYEWTHVSKASGSRVIVIFVAKMWTNIMKNIRKPYNWCSYCILLLLVLLLLLLLVVALVIVLIVAVAVCVYIYIFIYSKHIVLHVFQCPLLFFFTTNQLNLTSSSMKVSKAWGCNMKLYRICGAIRFHNLENDGRTSMTPLPKSRDFCWSSEKIKFSQTSENI